MTDREFILWVCGLSCPIKLMNPWLSTQKLEEGGAWQAQMVAEHRTCYPDGAGRVCEQAELIPDKETRARHLTRCLTLQVGEIKS